MLRGDPGVRAAAEAALRAEAEATPAVDGHCHPVEARPASCTAEYLRAFSEAGSLRAASEARSSVPVLRALKEVGALLGAPAGAGGAASPTPTSPTPEAVFAAAEALGRDEVARRCFEAANLSAIILDANLGGFGGGAESQHSENWHRGHVPVVKHVLRVETVAEQVLADLLGRDIEGPEDLAGAFAEELRHRLRHPRPGTVGYKSIVGYRTGLRVDPGVSFDDMACTLRTLVPSFRARLAAGEPLRLATKAVNDWVFTVGLSVAAEKAQPLQIHTGFGDPDLDLVEGNPALLKAVIEDERFHAAPLVLLHASWPYCREAAYLAQVYANVHLDCSLAIPMLSISAMAAAMAELLSLCPLKKLCWSSDAHAFPERFFTGAKWGRAMLAAVLADCCARSELTLGEAKAAVRDVLYSNSNDLYGLALPALPSLPAYGEVGAPAALAAEPGLPPSVKYVRLLYADGAGIRRCRLVTRKGFEDEGPDRGVARTGLGLARVCAIGMPFYADVPVPDTGLDASGEVRLVPDACSCARGPVSLPWTGGRHAVAFCRLAAEDPEDAPLEGPGRPLRPSWLCPRGVLKKALARFEATAGVEPGTYLLAGFESEFYLLDEAFAPLRRANTVYCESRALEAWATWGDDLLEALAGMGLNVEQYHAESGPGQLEVSTEAGPPMRAAEDCILVREAAVALALRHQGRATFSPKPVQDQAGSGCHLHVSVNQPERITGEGFVVVDPPRPTETFRAADAEAEVSVCIDEVTECFAAGVLHFLPGIMALTTPSPASFERIRDGCWAGAWRCWGPKNREAPIRIVRGRVELKACDGSSNPFLALAAVITAGTLGIERGLSLPAPFLHDPARSQGAGAAERLPGSVEEAWQALEGDAYGDLREALGEDLLRVLGAVRRAEARHCAEALAPEAARALFCERY